MSVPQSELETYIARAEERFAADLRPEVAALFAGYRELCERFATELGDARDVAVSRAAALMLIQTRAKAAA